VATIQAEVAKVEASISTAVNAVQRAVVSSRDEFKQELADLAAKTKETDARIADIAIQQESTIANLANQISALQSQINALQQEIENLKKQ
jgi:chromosome segregation ATPase